jgi:hypothetical protein
VSGRPKRPELSHGVIPAQAGSVDTILAREFEPFAQAIRNWVAQADRDNGHRSDGLSSSEKEELARLRLDAVKASFRQQQPVQLPSPVQSSIPPVPVRTRHLGT